ncbi:MAG: hypothetical protein LV480_14965 [Methylacidiphilales bacterium]|nr:hypothetical protein [Candidatus Methylacidiphilales bacterium]
MKTNLLHKFPPPLALGGALVLALTCFSTQAQAGPVLPAVGPRPPGEYDKVSCGYLEVFSRTQETQWGEGSYYYPHTAYWIYNSDGKRIKTVENHDTDIDESPQKVDLAPGAYVVKAWSDNDGLVTVPVIIKVAQTTTVHLENGRTSDNDIFNPAKAVKTPSGQIVGWKA